MIESIVSTVVGAATGVALGTVLVRWWEWRHPEVVQNIVIQENEETEAEREFWRRHGG